MNRRAVLGVLVGALGACSSAPTEVVARPVEGRAHARRIQLGDGLANVAQVAPFLYRGAQPNAQGYERLRRLGVKTVISFRYFFGSKSKAEAAGLEYVGIPMYASVGSSAPTDEQLQRFFDVVLDPARQPVFFHCKHGKDRTGTMAALYRMERDGWTAAEAIEEMQAFGYHDIFVDLIAFVEGYEPRGFRSPVPRPPIK